VRTPRRTTRRFERAWERFRAIGHAKGERAAIERLLVAARDARDVEALNRWETLRAEAAAADRNPAVRALAPPAEGDAVAAFFLAHATRVDSLRFVATRDERGWRVTDAASGASLVIEDGRADRTPVSLPGVPADLVLGRGAAMLAGDAPWPEHLRAAPGGRVFVSGHGALTRPEYLAGGPPDEPLDADAATLAPFFAARGATPSAWWGFGAGMNAPRAAQPYLLVAFGTDGASRAVYAREPGGWRLAAETP